VHPEDREMKLRTFIAAAVLIASAGLSRAYINPGIEILRGDVNNDARVDVMDPITLTNWLFNSTGTISCLKAADENDDGRVDIADIIFLNNYLYMGGPPPLAPFPSCGADPTSDALSCVDSACR
jgi:hypothetical protein